MKYLVQRVKLLLEGIIIFWRFLLIPTLGRVSRRKVEKTKFCEKHRFGENIMSAAISFSQAVPDFYFVNAQKRFNLNAAKYILISMETKALRDQRDISWLCFTWKVDNIFSLIVWLSVDDPASRAYLVSRATTWEVAKVKILRISIKSGNCASWKKRWTLLCRMIVQIILWKTSARHHITRVNSQTVFLNIYISD